MKEENDLRWSLKNEWDLVDGIERVGNAAETQHSEEKALLGWYRFLGARNMEDAFENVGEILA